MYKAVFLANDFQAQAPTAKELKEFLAGSGKLLFGNDQRKSKNTPFADRLHLVTNCLHSFSHLFNSDSHHVTSTLYIFDDKINETHFLLKYSSQVITHFLLDEHVIDDMHHITWSHSSLKTHLNSVRHDMDKLDFFVKKGIGDVKFHKSFPAYIKATNTFLTGIENEMKKLENNALHLLQSHW